ncbi:MAG: aldose 1-epimerase [Alphaproteobacteria bacterium]
MSEVLTLRAGNLEAGVAPDIGGALTHFRRADGVDLMRAADTTALADGNVLGVACFPLVPYSGRIAGGRLNFAGRRYALPINAPPDPNALHGDGWQCPWQVDHADAGEVRMTLPDPGRGWPWAYSARQAYRLAEEGLTVTLSVTNESAEPMPAGLGIHPWFDATPDATLQFRAGSVFRVDAGYLFTGVTPIPDEWDFTAARPVSGTGLVNGFAEWTGVAEIVWPARQAALRIEAEPPLTHLVVYTPPGQNFFCVEPVSHSVDAFNLHAAGSAAGNGTAILGPGETLTGSARFLVGVPPR